MSYKKQDCVTIVLIYGVFINEGTCERNNFRRVQGIKY